ncbi:hypothetical protein BDV96DRAFT_45607 [Lophiotrema nucula]|uniref:Zn(2)-C6 fungal-type domain-containing protein n=1 Tax=Lophiotrema nucula TaxID=690887 RepID=A0A6A5ZBX3_9PLEO|nr:hypothetical protein BDV96DRAFT_45607 [Lophiotrema nucula]
MMSKVEPKSRQRAWTPKSRTGCITCRYSTFFSKPEYSMIEVAGRIRKIKCDETKPACTKCTTTGRKCDGYSPPKPKHLSEMPDATNDEKEGFHYFRTFTATESTDYVSESQLVRQVLQLSHSISTVRHAAIALGAMHQRFVLKKELAVNVDVMDPTMRFALLQYNNAIQQTIEISRSKRRISQAITLVSCMLFTALSSIQGHYLQTILHLGRGMEILEALERIQKARCGMNQPLPVSLPVFRSIFERLNVQCRFYLDLGQLRVWRPTAIAVPQAPKAPFKSIQAALSFYIDLFYALTLVLQSSNPVRSSEFSHDRSLIQSIELQFEFGEDACRYIPLDGSLSWASSKKTVHSLSVYRTSTKLFLHIAKKGPTRMETHWDELHAEFNQVVKHSSIIYDASANEIFQDSYQTSIGGPLLKQGVDQDERVENERVPWYAFNPGPIELLFTVATRCRDPYLRRAAIYLMMKFPRREGVWNSVVAGGLAQEAMDIEERLALEEKQTPGTLQMVRNASDIPDDCRIYGIALDVDGPRTARVRFRRKLDYELGLDGFIMNIQ